MKDLSALRLAMVYAGCFLGAGYVSGQELWQYFGVFGVMGCVGLLAAMGLLFLLGLLILRLSQMTGIFEAEKLTVPWDIPVLRSCFSVLEIVMMFAIIAIMNAGVGALAEQLFGIDHRLVSAIFALAVLVCTLAGLKSIVSVFSFSVPCLVAAAIVIALAVFAKGGRPTLPTDSSGGLLGNWFVSSMNYACYNIFVTIAIMAPFGEYVKKRATTLVGIGLGSAALFAIAAGVLFSVASVSGAWEAELPMLYVASSLHKGAALVYALLLVLAMFGTALSSQVSVVNYFTGKSRFIAGHCRIFIIIISLLSYGAGLFGFGDLIGVLYPLFGYASLLFIVLMAVHYFMISKNKVEKL